MRIKKKLEHLLPWSRAGKQFSRRGILIGLALCFLLALGVRIFAWQIEPTISRDGIYYINKAEILQLDDNDPKKIQYMQSALDYFTNADNPSGYSSAYAELRDVQMSKYFTLLFGTVIVVGVGLFVMVQVRKAMRNKAERKRRLGL